MKSVLHAACLSGLCLAAACATADKGPRERIGRDARSEIIRDALERLRFRHAAPAQATPIMRVAGGRQERVPDAAPHFVPAVASVSGPQVHKPTEAEPPSHEEADEAQEAGVWKKAAQSCSAAFARASRKDTAKAYRDFVGERKDSNGACLMRAKQRARIEYWIRRPRSAHSLTQMGDVESLRSETKGVAIGYYSKAISIDPEHAPAYLGRGKAHMATREDGKAREDFEMARRLDSRDYESSYNLGRLYEKRDSRRALESYSRAIALSPRCAACLHDRGVLHSKMLNRRGAARDFREVLRLARKERSEWSFYVESARRYLELLEGRVQR
ncbi:tetratricopeptide repeat protein [Elusimicrobiota bacterium]